MYRPEQQMDCLCCSTYTLLFVVQIEVGNPAEVDEIFDTISYCKGASIIRMLHNYIGDDVSIFVIVHVRVCVRMCVYMCVWLCVCVLVCVCVCVCV